MITLKTRRLLLAPWREEDAEALYALAADPELSATAQREMGYWLGRPYWGHGVMTEAATELLRFGFEMLGLEAVWCSHYDWNSRSRRVIEKCGFRYQFTKETTNVIGMTNKTVFYALKKEEWLAFSGEKEFA